MPRFAPFLLIIVLLALTCLFVHGQVANCPIAGVDVLTYQPIPSNGSSIYVLSSICYAGYNRTASNFSFVLDNSTSSSSNAFLSISLIVSTTVTPLFSFTNTTCGTTPRSTTFIADHEQVRLKFTCVANGTCAVWWGITWGCQGVPIVLSSSSSTGSERQSSTGNGAVERNIWGWITIVNACAMSIALLAL